MIFTEEHLWLREEDGEMVVGLSQHAVDELGEIVFLELPEEGTTISRDDEVVVIEGSMEASDVLAPIDGEITEANTALTDNPSLLNEDAQGEAWLFKMTVSDASQMDEFMTEAAYQKYV